LKEWFFWLAVGKTEKLMPSQKSSGAFEAGS
jgi:hypothetical protein